MSVYKRGASWRAEIKSDRIGEMPYRCTRTFDTKIEAKAFEKSQYLELAEARRLGRTMPETLSVKDALEKWWLETEKSQAPSYRITNQYRKEAWKKVYFAEIPIRDLTVQHLEGWVRDEREKEKSESTIRNCLYVLRSLYKHAKKKWKWAIADPTIEVLGEVGASNKRDRRLSEKEHRQLVDVFALMQKKQCGAINALAHDPLAKIVIKRSEIVQDNASERKIEIPYHDSLRYISPAFETAIEAAMRRGRMFEIQWKWIDWDARMILIPPESQGPANKRAPARLPMSPGLFNTLKQLNGVDDNGAIKHREGDEAEAAVFGTLASDRAYRLLRLACHLLGIKDLHWHDLRHEACSRLAEADWTIQQIQVVSGHKTLQSLQRYMHIRPETIHRLWDRKAQEEAAA